MDHAAQLHRLQQLENEEQDVRDRLKRIEDALGETPALRRARRKVEKTGQALRRLNTRQKDLELQADTVKHKISSSEQKLYSGNIRNPKELSDRQAEVASLKRRLSQTEERLLETMIAREEAEATEQAAREKLEQAEAEWEASQGDLVGERRELRERLAVLEKAEADVSSQIPGDILKIYRDLRRTKGKRAVVPVQGQTCTGCWTESPLSLLKRSRPDELLFCDNCGRVLLLEE
ncbi:MAG: hypothetical protein PVI59_02785 [Anaerolineae bacterium]|jgi:predicted  nucleic acid-binding Zn-ribbon protein